MPITYEKIATTTLSSNQSSVLFSSISSSYTDLVFVADGSTTNSGGNITARFNGDTGSNYSRTRMLGDGSAASSERQSNTTQVAIGDWSLGRANFVLNLASYSNGAINKTVLCRANETGFVLSLYGGLWRGTAAINSVEFFKPGGSYTAGTTFTIYGILKA